MNSAVEILALSTLMATAVSPVMAEDCPVSGTLPGTPPSTLIAMLGPDCFDQVQKKFDARTVMDLGYPSRLFKLISKTEVLDLLSMAVNEGDRGFFESDADILLQVEGWGDTKTVEFIQATLSPEEILQKKEVSTDFLMALPLWGRPENSQFLVDYCEGHDCEVTRTACPDSIGLSDKLAVAKGEKSLNEIQNLCPMSHEWIRSLRQAGLVDTICTSTMQINRVMVDPETLNNACYPQEMSLQDIPAATTTDAIRYLRQYLLHDPMRPISDGNIDYISEYWPDVADYLTTIGSEEGKR